MKHSTTKVFTIEALPPAVDFAEEEDLPIAKRKCRDTTFLLLFIAFLTLISYIIIDIIFIKHSNPNLLIHGYDNYGNICGQPNKPLPNVTNSGQNMTQYPYLLIESVKNSSLRTRCVTECPEQDFFLIAFYRCLPKDSRLPFLIDAYNTTRSFLEDLVSDIYVCWKEITYLCSISLVFAMIILILLRYLANIIIWVTLFAFSLTAVSGSAYVWLIWNYYKTQLLAIDFDDKQKAIQQQLVDQWFVVGITASVLTFIFILIVTVMRKRIKLVAILFREAGKAISDMPFLLLQPVWTFCILFLISMLWIYGLVYLHSSRIAFIDPSNGFVSYKLLSFYRYMKWYHIFAYVWVVHFVLSCQHFVISGSVGLWFFKRNKFQLNCPQLKTIGLLIRYHLGSIALGSLLEASVKLLRLIVKRLESLFNRYKDGCDRTLKCCRCCLWFFEKFIIYVNKNAYIEIAIYGDSYCTGAQKAFSMISNNALRVLALNSVGDFLLFVAKICVVSATAFIGVYMIEDKRHLLNYYWAPIITCSMFAYFVAHCFLSVYQMAIDTLFLCFIEDSNRNDGITRPYFMSKGLMNFIDNSFKSVNNQIQNIH